MGSSRDVVPTNYLESHIKGIFNPQIHTHKKSES